MYSLNLEAIKAILLDNSAPAEAILIYADAKPEDGTSQHKIVYLVLERGMNVGQGLANYGDNWEATADFYTTRYSGLGLGIEIEADAIHPVTMEKFVNLSTRYLERTNNAAATAVEPAPVTDRLTLGICETPEEFGRHVGILAKDLTDFRFKYDHLAMFAALAMRLDQVGNDLDFVKKASLYEDETKLQHCSPLFKQLMLEIFNTDEAHGQGKSLVHKDALYKLENDVKTRDALHMLVGILGEAGEIAKTVHDFLTTGVIVMEGKDSLPEEIGDLRFYVAGLLGFLGLTEQQNNQQNYNKLKARYPAGYTNEAAINRDLAAEDKALRE